MREIEQPSYFNMAADEIQASINESDLSPEIRVRISFSMALLLMGDEKGSNNILDVMNEELGISQNNETILNAKSIIEKYKQAA